MSNADDIEARFHSLLMAKSPSERLAMACRMFATAKALVLAGIEQQYGKLPPNELRRHLLLRLYGRDFSKERLEAIAKSLTA